MVNAGLVEAILREQNNPGCSTTRQIRDLYNSRSGDDPIIPQSDEDKQFQKLLLKALEECPVEGGEVDNDDEDDEDNDDEPISYTVKLKDSDETVTPTMKHRSIIKLSKESKSQSESDESSSDSEKTTATNKPFSPLFLNNMKKFGVSSDWLAKRSNSLRQSAYSLSSVKSNTSKLDAMIKSASAKPVRSNRKLSFVEGATSTKVEADKENADPASETNNDQKDDEQEIEEEVKDAAATSSEPPAHDLSSEVNENEKDSERSSPSKDFSLRIPRIDLPSEEKKRPSKRSSSSASSLSDEEVKPEKPKPKLKKRAKKEASSKKATPKRSYKKKVKDESAATKETKHSSKKDDNDTSMEIEEEKDTAEKNEEDESATTTDTKKAGQKKDKADQEQSRVEHLKKLLRISGIRHMIKKSELDEFSSHKAKIKFLKSLFDQAGYTGNLSIKECQKFREKRDTEKELLEIQQSTVDVKGYVKGGRTLRGQGRVTTDSEIDNKRKRVASSEVEDNEDSSDSDKPITKKRRVLQMEASPEISDNE